MKWSEWSQWKLEQIKRMRINTKSCFVSSNYVTFIETHTGGRDWLRPKAIVCLKNVVDEKELSEQKSTHDKREEGKWPMCDSWFVKAE